MLLPDRFSNPEINRLRAAIEALRDEADDLQQAFNDRYPELVQQGRVTALLGISNRIGLLRHMADQIAAIPTINA